MGTERKLAKALVELKVAELQELGLKNLNSARFCFCFPRFLASLGSCKVKEAQVRYDGLQKRVSELSERAKAKREKREKVLVKSRKGKPAKNEPEPTPRRERLDHSKCIACQQIQRVSEGKIKKVSGKHSPQCPLGWKRAKTEPEDSD